MMSDEFTSCPIVRDETIELFDRVEVGGKDRFLSFTQRVLWLRKSDSKLTLVHRGATVDDLSTFSDFYGFLSSLKGVVGSDMMSLMKRYQLDATSDLMVSVSTTITDTPVLMMPDGGDYAECRGNPKKRQPYRNVPSYYNGKKWWYTSDRADNEFGRRPTLEPVPVVTVDGIYTSHDEPDVLPDRALVWIEAEKANAVPIDVYAYLRTKSVQTSAANAGKGE